MSGFRDDVLRTAPVIHRHSHKDSERKSHKSVKHGKKHRSSKDNSADQSRKRDARGRKDFVPILSETRQRNSKNKTQTNSTRSPAISGKSQSDLFSLSSTNSRTHLPSVMPVPVSRTSTSDSATGPSSESALTGGQSSSRSDDGRVVREVSGQACETVEPEIQKPSTTQSARRRSSQSTSTLTLPLSAPPAPLSPSVTRTIAHLLLRAESVARCRSGAAAYCNRRAWRGSTTWIPNARIKQNEIEENLEIEADSSTQIVMGWTDKDTADSESYFEDGGICSFVQ
eukprot:922430_1